MNCNRVIKFFALSDIGPVRQNNEDNYAVTLEESNEKGAFILCDGMGGHEHGEIASKTAAEELKKLFASLLKAENVNEIEGFEELLIQAVKNANDKVYELNVEKGLESDRRRMGTTVVAAILVGENVYIIHVGDSRCYIYDGKETKLVTTDHNLANQLLQMGVFTSEEEALAARGSKALTQAVGTGEGFFIRPTVYKTQMEPPFKILLCSDGLTDVVEQEEIHKILSLNQSNPKNMSKKLIKKAYKNGTQDNITVILMTAERGT